MSSVHLTKESKAKLEELRKKEEEDLVSILSQKYGLPYINLEKEYIDTEALRLVSEDEARRAEVAPFAIKKNKLAVAVRTPNTTFTKQALEKLRKRGYVVTPYMASQASLSHAWDRYKDISFATETCAGVIGVTGDDVINIMDKFTSLKKTKEILAEKLSEKGSHKTSRAMEILLAGAMANGASDIHIEPEEESVRVRYRIDGVLVQVASIDPEVYPSILVRIKLVSGLKINIKKSAQDGRFSVHIQEKEVEIRTSILPGNYGESIVMRILDPESIQVSLNDLGIAPKLLSILKREMKRPNGMILNTGPTGSGKTTTLYAFLKHILNPNIKILTIEDPIEYHLHGIVQTQVNGKDYTFASGLRSALRQDPDVIMVGEIRDKEVATTAAHAALTGHLVFSTLHTNNAVGAFPRLVDIGIDPSIVGSAVNVVMAQRLLRTLIPDKKKEVPIEGEDRKFVDAILDGVQDKSLIPENTDTMWVPDVPEGDIEYRGRIGVYEAILSTREIENAIRDNKTIRELSEVAKGQGIPSMHEDAIIKVLSGVTTLSEVRRVLGDTTNTF